MIGNKGQTAKSDNQDNYEAAVLDFLDKEMAAARTTQETKDQSDELDAIVSDLLKQVITESDQQQIPDGAVSEDLTDLVAEFQSPVESQPPPADSITLVENKAEPDEPVPVFDLAENLQPYEAAPEVKAEKDAPVFEKPEPAIAETKTLSTPAGSLFAAPATRKSRMPLMAAALVCLAAGIAVPVYFFSGSSGSTPKTTASQPLAQAPAVPTVASQTVQAPAPSPNTAATKVVPPVANDKSVVANSPKAPIIAPQKTSPVPGKQPQVTPGNAASPAPVKEEKQAAAPLAPTPAPAPVAPSAPAEKPVAAVIPENTAPPSIIIDKNSAPSIAINSSSSESLNLDMRPSATVHAIPKNIVASYPISQPKPNFPEFALRTRASGSVVLDLEIDSQGKVTKATPVSGPEIFRKEAVSAVMKWRYKPASVGGSNVPSQSRVTLNFNPPK